VNNGEKINDKKNSWAYHASLRIGESLGKSMPNASSFITEHPVIMDETLYTTLAAGTLTNLEDWHIALFIIMFHQYSLIPDTTVGNTHKYSLFNALLAIKPAANADSVTQSIKNLNRLILGLHDNDAAGELWGGSWGTTNEPTFNSDVNLKEGISNLIIEHFSNGTASLIAENVNIIARCFKHSLCNHANNELPAAQMMLAVGITPFQNLQGGVDTTVDSSATNSAIFTITNSGTGVYTFEVTTAGSGYNKNDTIVVKGSSLGGVDGDSPNGNDATLLVSGSDSSLTSTNVTITGMAVAAPLSNSSIVPLNCPLTLVT